MFNVETVYLRKPVNRNPFNPFKPFKVWLGFASENFCFHLLHLKILEIHSSDIKLKGNLLSFTA